MNPSRPCRSGLAVLALSFLFGCDGCSGPERPKAAPPAPPPAPERPIAPAPTARGDGSLPGEGEAAGIAYRMIHTGGADPSATLPLIVAIHGLGDRPEHFALLDSYPGRARVVYPRGLTAHHDGYSWFPIDPTRASQPGAETVAGIERAADGLARMIAAVAAGHPTVGKPIVTGFSQGGMLSFAIALRHPEAIAAAFPIAGYLPAALLEGRTEGSIPPIVALHGDADPLIAVASARDTVSRLRGAGFAANLIEYPQVGHSVSPAMMRELFRQLLDATP